MSSVCVHLCSISSSSQLCLSLCYLNSLFRVLRVPTFVLCGFWFLFSFGFPLFPALGYLDFRDIILPLKLHVPPSCLPLSLQVGPQYLANLDKNPLHPYLHFKSQNSFSTHEDLQLKAKRWTSSQVIYLFIFNVSALSLLQPG